MSDWVEYKLRDIGTLARGKSKHRPRYAFHLFGGQYPFVQTGEIKAAKKYIKSYENTYSDAGLAQSKLWPRGTICITIAANIAELAILDIEACFPDSVIGFIPNKKKSNVDFMYYSLCYFQKELKELGIGSVQDNINLQTFELQLFPVPSLYEQEAIAEVLSSLDDKIDLLHRNNKTLEQLAETLFRQWFVEEADDSWEEIRFSQLATHIKKSVNPSSIPGKMYFHYSLPAFDNGKNPEFHLGASILSNKYQVASNQILISKLNPRTPRVWYLQDCTENSICSTEFQVYQAKNEIYNEFVYCFLKTNNTTDILGGAASGTSGSHQRVSPDIINSLVLKKPEGEKIILFHERTFILLKKIGNNTNQIKQLETLRDTLLPKLMSGSVKVNNLTYDTHH